MKKPENGSIILSYYQSLSIHYHLISKVIEKLIERCKPARHISNPSFFVDFLRAFFPIGWRTGVLRMDTACINSSPGNVDSRNALTERRNNFAHNQVSYIVMWI